MLRPFLLLRNLDETDKARASAPAPDLDRARGVGSEIPLVADPNADIVGSVEQAATIKVRAQEPVFQIHAHAESKSW